MGFDIFVFLSWERIELLKMAINKTASIDHFRKTETNGELIFQQLYCFQFDPILSLEISREI